MTPRAPPIGATLELEDGTMLLARRSEDVHLEDEVVARKVDRILARASADGGRPISEVINDTLYHERLRLEHAKDDERARSDREFHARVRHELPPASPTRQSALVRAIVERYVAEITGHFDPRVLELLRRDLKQPDIFRMLRTIGADTGVDVARLEAEVEKLLEELRALEHDGKIRLSDELRTTAGSEIVARGLRGLGTYHTTPIAVRRGTQAVVLDADLLFYYRNRLEGYGLLGAPRLTPTRTAK